MKALGYPLNFSRLAVVTGQCTCQSLGGNCEHCQFEFYSWTGRTFVFNSKFVLNLPGGRPPAAIT